MQPKKVYIAAPFRRDSNRDLNPPHKAYGAYDDDEKKAVLESVEDVFLADGWVTCLPHRDEGRWGKEFGYEPDEIGRLCFRHVDTSDLILALPGRSRGVAAELGRASAAGTPILVFLEEDEEPSTLLGGLAQSPVDPSGLPRRGEICIHRVDRYADVPRRLESLLGVTRRQETSDLNVSIVDIGSNSIKLSTFSTQHGRRPFPIDDANGRESIAIADSVRSSGRISNEKLSEIEVVLRGYRSKADRKHARIRVVGTEALRRAQNLDDIHALVERILGSKLEVLTQHDEAKAVADAVRSSLNTAEPTSSLNLGASSVQVVTGLESTAQRVHLYNFGTKDLTESYPWVAPMANSAWVAVLDAARDRLQSGDLVRSEKQTFLYQTGGELDFFLRCRLDMSICRIDPTHVSLVSVEHFRDFAATFAARHPAEVKSETRLQTGWLSGAVASNAIALATAEMLRASYLVPSNLNVVDGLLP